MNALAILVVALLAALSLAVGSRVTAAARERRAAAPRRRGLAVAGGLFLTPPASFLVLATIAETRFALLPTVGGVAALVFLGTGLYVLAAAPFERRDENGA